MPIFHEARCPVCATKVTFPAVPAAVLLVHDGVRSYLRVQPGSFPDVEHTCAPEAP
jgi:hypothetical protein